MFVQPCKASRKVKKVKYQEFGSILLREGVYEIYQATTKNRVDNGYIIILKHPDVVALFYSENSDILVPADVGWSTGGYVFLKTNRKVIFQLTD